MIDVYNYVIEAGIGIASIFYIRKLTKKVDVKVNQLNTISVPATTEYINGSPYRENAKTDDQYSSNEYANAAYAQAVKSLKQEVELYKSNFEKVSEEIKSLKSIANKYMKCDFGCHKRITHNIKYSGTHYCPQCEYHYKDTSKQFWKMTDHCRKCNNHVVDCGICNTNLILKK